MSNKALDGVTMADVQYTLIKSLAIGKRHSLQPRDITKIKIDAAFSAFSDAEERFVEDTGLLLSDEENALHNEEFHQAEMAFELAFKKLKLTVARLLLRDSWGLAPDLKDTEHLTFEQACDAFEHHFANGDNDGDNNQCSCDDDCECDCHQDECGCDDFCECLDFDSCECENPAFDADDSDKPSLKLVN